MSLTGMVAPYGLRHIRLFPLSGSFVDLPAPRTMTFKEQTNNNELRGGDVVVASVTFAEAVELELEAGGIALDAYALMTGRTLTNAGTTPNRTSTMTATAGDSFPYFRIYGRAITDAGDIWARFYRVQVTSIEGEFKGDEFFITKCSLKAIQDSGSANIFQFVRNETATALPTSWS